METLGAFDRGYLSNRAVVHPPNPKKEPNSISTTGRGGTGYGADVYRSRDGVGKASSSRGTKKLEAAMVAYDTSLLRAFQTIGLFLPNPTSDAIYDLLPHRSIRSLLHLSYLPETLAQLLRNDSVHEWTQRSESYHEMVQLLKRLADSELSFELLVCEGREKKSSPGLEEWIWGAGEIEWEMRDSADVVSTPPLYDFFTKLARQCTTFLKLMDQSELGGENEAEEIGFKTSALCLDILGAREDIERTKDAWLRQYHSDDVSLQGASSFKAKGKAKDTDPIHMDTAYLQACERLAFEHVTLSEDSPTAGGGLIYSRHLYATKLSATSASRRNPKQLLHLVKELSVIATSLPPGIWMRVDDVRNDAMYADVSYTMLWDAVLI